MFIIIIVRLLLSHRIDTYMYYYTLLNAGQGEQPFIIIDNSSIRIIIISSSSSSANLS